MTIKWHQRLLARYNEQATAITFAATVVAAIAGLYLGADKAAIIGIVVAVSLLLIVHAVKHQKDLVPEPVDIFSADDFHVLHATPSLLEEAIQIGRRAFPRDCIAPDTVRRMHAVDSTFVCVAIDRGSMRTVGYLDCYVLRDTPFTKDFIAGTADEDCFDLNSVAPLAALHKGLCLYVAGLVVEEENRTRRGRITRALVSLAMETLIAGIKDDTAEVLVISVAYTQHGRKMLEAFGLSLCTTYGRRRDAGYLYFTRINRRLLKGALENTVAGNHRTSLPLERGMPASAFMPPGLFLSH